MKILVVLFLLFVTFASAKDTSPKAVKPIFRKHPELFKVYTLLDELEAHLSKKGKGYGLEYENLYSSWKNLSELSTKARIVYGKAKFQAEQLKGIIKKSGSEQQKLFSQSERAQQAAFQAKLEENKASKLAGEALKKFKDIEGKVTQEKMQTDADMKAIAWLKEFIGRHHGLDCFYGEWKRVPKLLGNVHCRSLECCKLYKHKGQWRSFCEKKHKVCK